MRFNFLNNGLLYLFKIIIFPVRWAKSLIKCFCSPIELIEFPQAFLYAEVCSAKLFNYSNHLSIVRKIEIQSGLLMDNAAGVKTLLINCISHHNIFA